MADQTGSETVNVSRQAAGIHDADKSQKKVGDKLRILFVNPPSPDGRIYIRDVNRSGRLSKEGTLWPQTSLALLAAMFPSHEVSLIDCIAQKISFHGLFKRMRDFRPDWVVFISVSTTVYSDMITAHYGKALGARTVTVSPHFEALRDDSMKAFPALDYALNYERMEEPEYELRRIITGQQKEVDENFETLPAARQDLLPLPSYNLPFIGRGYTFVITSRGCPWRCIYCRQGVTWKSRVRYRRVEDIVGEIYKYRLTNISFHADTATVDKVRMSQLCERIYNLPWKVRWICNSRVDTVEPWLLAEMKRAGCWMIVYGCESGNDKVLEMNKKQATVKDAENAVKWAKAAGLKVWGYFMLGMYGDTLATMRDTINLSKRLPFDIVNYAVAAPYPGTEWGQIAESNGYLTDNNWESMDQNYSAIVNQPGCSPEDVKSMQRKAYLEWYGSWRGIKFMAQGWRPQYARYFWTTAMNHLQQG